jgi:hypothetical protein
MRPKLDETVRATRLVQVCAVVALEWEDQFLRFVASARASVLCVHV